MSSSPPPGSPPQQRTVRGRPSLLRYAWLSIAAAVVTIALKTGAWALTGSVGLLSDAAESVVNLVAAVVVMMALRISARPPDDDHHYGHAKVEYFSAAIEAAMIFVAAAAIMVTALDRFLHPQPLENVGLGLAVSCVAAGINGVVGTILIRAGAQHRSLTLTADGRHLMTDVWTSAGVVVGVLAVAVTGWLRLDGAVAFAVGCNIIVTGTRLLVQSVNGLMDHAVDEGTRHAIVDVLQDQAAAAGVSVHGLRTRESGHHVFISAHVVTPAAWTVGDGVHVVVAIREELAVHVPGSDVVVQLETVGDPCPAVSGPAPTPGAGPRSRAG